MLKKSSGPSFSGRHLGFGRPSPKQRLGLDSEPGPSVRADDGYEMCIANNDHMLGTVGVRPYHMNALGQPTAPVLVRGKQIACCTSANCIAKGRADLEARGIKVYMGNPVITARLIAERANQQTAPTPTTATKLTTTSSSSRATN